MEDWQAIRERCVARGEPMKRVSRETGIALNTIRKYVESSMPPQRCGAPTRTPVMAAYESDVDALLKQDANITAARIAQVLRDRHPSFDLRERAVRSYVARRRRFLHPREVFIRQVYVPGDHYVESRVMLSLAEDSTFEPGSSAFYKRRTRHNYSASSHARRPFSSRLPPTTSDCPIR
jgi:hypothetical protein